MNDVLYRKYRAATFAEIIGQEHVVSILKSAILNEKASHAYLFAGPRGTGKTSIARLLAKGVNCSNFKEKGDICNNCEECKLINNAEALDVIEMDAASNRGIEEIRNLKETINFLPVTLRKKIYILDEAHMLTKEAFNALLKTLEEPPSHVIFILATTEPNKIPLTVLSRVQRFDLTLASSIELVKKLAFIVQKEGFRSDPKALESIFKLSGGSFRDAESLLGKVMVNSTDKFIGEKEVASSLGLLETELLNNFIFSLLRGDYEGCMHNLAKITAASVNLSYFIEQLIKILKDLLVNAVNKSSTEFSVTSIIKLINAVFELKTEVKDFSDKEAIIQIFVIKYLHNNSVTTLEQNNTAQVKKTISARVISSTDVKTGPENDQVARFIAKCGEVSLRLKTALFDCIISLHEKVLLIKNPYKHTLAYLSKSEVLEIITKIARELFGDDLTLDLALLENINSKKSPEQREIEIEEVVTSKSEVKDDKILDNSELVESILLIS